MYIIPFWKDGAVLLREVVVHARLERVQPGPEHRGTVLS
jgi:hypothetical protein